MSDSKLAGKEFADNVWRKIRYLEYKKKEKELVLEKQREHRRKRIWLAAVCLSVLVPASLIFFLTAGLNTGTLFLMGSVYLGTGLIYESWPDAGFIGRRVKHGSSN